MRGGVRGCDYVHTLSEECMCYLLSECTTLKCIVLASDFSHLWVF